MSNTPHNSNYSANGHHHSSNGEHGKPATGLQPNDQEDDDIIDLSKLFRIGWHYKWILVFCILAGTIGSYVASQYMTPIYRSEGKLMIQEMRNRYTYGGSDISSLMSTAFGVGMGSTLSNELAVLQSRRFMDMVAENYISKASTDLNRFPLMDGGLDENENQQFATQTQIANRIRVRVNFSRVDQQTDVVNVVFESSSSEESALVVNTIIDTYNEFSTVENRRMSREGLQFLQGERDQVLADLNESEELLRDFMNREGLVALEEQSKLLINILTSLETELRTAEVEKSAVEAGLANYRAELETIRPGLGEQIIQSYAPRISRLQFEISELFTERELLLSRNPFLRETPEAEPRLAEINRRINDLEERVRETVNTLMEQDERYLGMIGSFDGNLIQSLSDMRKTVLELEVKEQQLNAQVDVLGTKIESLEGDFSRLPDNMVAYGRLRRNVELNTELYVLLERQAAEVAIWEQTQSGFGRLLDYGVVPERPVKPRVPLIMIFGFLLGGIVGVGYVTARELSRTSITSVDELRSKGLQILAVVPDLKEVIKKNFQGKPTQQVQGRNISTDLITFLDPISPASESYRRLFNNILYSEPDKDYRTIIVTSAGQGEGKTTTLTNMAITMAETGKKVIILDCDFRRPKIHKTFGVSQDRGVSDWLFSENTLDEVVKETVVPGLEIITAGKKVLNPANLVQSKRIKELIEDLRDTYEYVLIDTPPYGIITDAAPLMRHSDGVVVVSRFGATRHSDVDHTIENLNNIRVNILGAVLTAYDPSKSTGSYYYSEYYKYSYKNYDRYIEEDK